jgi:hypothetical protein
MLTSTSRAVAKCKPVSANCSSATRKNYTPASAKTTSATAQSALRSGDAKPVIISHTNNEFNSRFVPDCWLAVHIQICVVVHILSNLQVWCQIIMISLFAQDHDLDCKTVA